jgi:hypothetical protein
MKKEKTYDPLNKKEESSRYKGYKYSLKHSKTQVSRHTEFWSIISINNSKYLKDKVSKILI